MRINEAGQALFRMLAAMGPTAFETAELLRTYEWDITRAALAHGLGRKCAACAGRARAAMRDQEARRGCNGCVAAMRQRVHRLQDRVAWMLGDAAPVSRHRRPVVVYGADRTHAERDGRGTSSIYQRAAAEEAEAVEL